MTGNGGNFLKPTIAYFCEGGLRLYKMHISYNKIKSR